MNSTITNYTDNIRDNEQVRNSGKHPTNSSLKEQKYGLHSEKIKSFEIQKN
jgi:hypothetical protein